MISNGSMPGLAQRHVADVDVEPDLAFARHLRRGRGQAGGAEVLQSERAGSRSSSSRQHSSSFFSANGSPIWTDGRLASSPSPSSALASTEAPPIPSRPVSAPNSTSTLPGPGRGGADQALARREPEAHRVDQAVLLVALLEVDLAADRGHADRVAVVADPGDGVLEQVARALGRGRLAEAQRVEHRDRPRADREHVAQDPADAGGGALERLDRARVVVRLDLEGDREPVADVDRAGVLARADQHVRPLGREAAQQLLGVLVGAVLGPHQREHRQLDVARLAPEAVDDQLVLVVGEPELAVLGLGGPRRRHGARTATLDSTPARIDSKIVSPSTEPVSGSTACSGCGIRPNTLPRLVADAGDVAQRAVGVVAGGVAQHHLAAGLELVELRRRARSSGRSCA